jgi:hypothetical protein
MIMQIYVLVDLVIELNTGLLLMNHKHSHGKDMAQVLMLLVDVVLMLWRTVLL